MTGPNWKDRLLLLLGAAQSGEISLSVLTDETEENRDDLLEAMSVLQEIVPPLNEEQVKQALETDDGNSPDELENLDRALQRAETSSAWEKAGAKLLAALLLNLRLNGALDLNPSYLNRD